MFQLNIILRRSAHVVQRRDRRKRKAGPWHRNQAGDYLEPGILQITFAFQVHVDPGLISLVTLGHRSSWSINADTSIIKKCQWTICFWFVGPPDSQVSHSASCWVPAWDSKKSLSLALISKCLDFTLFWWEFSPGYWPVAIWTSWGEFKVYLYWELWKTTTKLYLVCKHIFVHLLQDFDSC